MTKKNILISCNRIIGIGGIEKSLVTFLNAFNKEHYNIILVVSSSDGEFFSLIDTSKIELYYTKNINPTSVLKDDLSAFSISNVIKGLYCRLALRFNKHWYAQIMYMYRAVSHKIRFDQYFDCAISFTTDYSDLGIISSVNTNKRVAFVHGDASLDKYVAKLNDKLLCGINKIYCVSKAAKKRFLSVHPACENAMDIFHNIVNESEVITKSKESVCDILHNRGIVLCTVGRIEHVKGQHLIPECAKILRDSGLEFKWYIIGSGDTDNINKEIVSKNLDQNVILCGARKNPYPYMKNCDIYVQTSLSEAYCITVREALILKKIIVSTNFPSVDEQITHEHNGVICEISSEALANGILKILNSNELKKKIECNLSMPLQQHNDMDKLYSFIES